MTFDAALSYCRDAGFDGVNVTYPYKEQAAALALAGDPVLRDMGAANTVCFSPEGMLAYNTDYSGFMSAYRARWGEAAPGRVLIIGAGGVGRAITFALGKNSARKKCFWSTRMKRKSQRWRRMRPSVYPGMVKPARPRCWRISPAWTASSTARRSA